MVSRRVGVPMTDRILDFLEEKRPGLKANVWKIFYPMREEQPIEVSVKPGALAGETLELEFEGKRLVVNEEVVERRPARTGAGAY